MSLVIQRETTEYLYVGFVGNLPSVSAEMAFLAAGARPTTEDWNSAERVDSEHALWGDATGTDEFGGDYFVACLVGDFQDNGVVLPPGDYQVWVRLTDDVERPVRIAPTALEVA